MNQSICKITNHFYFAIYKLWFLRTFHCLAKVYRTQSVLFLSYQDTEAVCPWPSTAEDFDRRVVWRAQGQAIWAADGCHSSGKDLHEMEKNTRYVGVHAFPIELMLLRRILSLRTQTTPVWSFLIFQTLTESCESTYCAVFSDYALHFSTLL